MSSEGGADMKSHDNASHASSAGAVGESKAVDAEETAHFTAVLQAFKDYGRWMELELRRREAHASQLPEHLLALL